MAELGLEGGPAEACAACREGSLSPALWKNVSPLLFAWNSLRFSVFIYSAGKQRMNGTLFLFLSLCLFNVDPIKGTAFPA